MLAKDQKINNLMFQRKYIKDNAMNCGGAAYAYVGEIFPENLTFFRSEGYDVVKVGENLISTKGLPVYCISVKPDITLTEEEMAQAESVTTTTAEAIQESIQNGIGTVKEGVGVLKESFADSIVELFGGTREGGSRE